MSVARAKHDRVREAVDGRVAASTQNQALSALLVLYREVQGQQLPRLDGA